jgi:hypothetical protein
VRLGIRLCAGADLLMELNLSATLFHNRFELAMHRRESIAYCDINIFVLLPIHSKLKAWQRNIDRYAIWPSLMLVFLQLLDTHTAGHELSRKGLQASYLLDRNFRQTLRGLKAPKPQM